MNERYIDDIEKLCSEIAEHSYHTHINEFSNEKFGDVLDVNNKGEFYDHAKATLENSDTQCFEVSEGFEKGTKFFYNEQTNTMVVVPGLERLENGQELPPTLYRPKDRQEHFKNKLKRTEKEQGFEPEIKKGIYELIPALEKEGTLQLEIQKEPEIEQKQKEAEKVKEKSQTDLTKDQADRKQQDTVKQKKEGNRSFEDDMKEFMRRAKQAEEMQQRERKKDNEWER